MEAEEMHATYTNTNTAVNNLRRLIKKTRLDIISIVYIRDSPVPNHWEEPTSLIIEHDCKGFFQRVRIFLVHILKNRNSNIYRHYTRLYDLSMKTTIIVPCLKSLVKLDLRLFVSVWVHDIYETQQLSK